jgi:hypothetical protein
LRGAVQFLRSINEFYETVAGLPYSLWALLDCSGWLDWVA